MNFPDGGGGGGSQGGAVIIVVAVLVFKRVIKILLCQSCFHGSGVPKVISRLLWFSFVVHSEG